MARQLVMYECEHCNRVLRKTKRGIENHEVKCFSNLATRSCITCESYRDAKLGNINDRRQSRKCEIGISLLERLQTNCANWRSIDHDSENN